MTAASYPISRGSPRQSTESAEALFRHSIANFCSGSSIVGSNSSVRIALSLVRVPTSGDQDVDRGDRPVYHDRQSARGNHPSGRRPRQTDRAVSAAQGAATHPPEMKVPTLLAVARHRGTKISNPFPSSGESGELLYSAAGSSRSRRRCANEETSATGRMALFHHLIGAGEDRLWDRQA